MVIDGSALGLAALAAAEGEESPSLFSLSDERELAAELQPEVLPRLKAAIRDSCVDPEKEEFVAASARAAPVVRDRSRSSLQVAPRAGWSCSPVEAVLTGYSVCFDGSESLVARSEGSRWMVSEELA